MPFSSDCQPTRDYSKKMKDLLALKDDLTQLALKDPLGKLDPTTAKAFFDKYGSIEAVEQKLRLPNRVQDVRHVWRDHELDDEETAALKEVVQALSRTHPKVCLAGDWNELE
jgi:hypothetical protein